MESLTFAVLDEGLLLPAVVGLNAPETAALLAASLPLVNPVTVTAEIDTGSTITAVSERLLLLLGTPSTGVGHTTTAFGDEDVELFRVGLSLFGPAGANGPMFVQPNLLVSKLTWDLAGIDVLIGRNLLLECHLHLDGPARQFTLMF